MAVTEGATNNERATRHGAGRPILIGLFLAIALGAGGFFAVFLGWLPLPTGAGPETSAESDASDPPQMERVEFVALDPMVISLGGPGTTRHLRFRAELEIVPGRSADVRAVLPRVQDTLNGYLRAVPLEELETPSALVRLRAQMLKRLQLVTPQGSVRDFLITEFVLT